MTKELFLQITDWQRATFPNKTLFSCVRKLISEVDELSEAVDYAGLVVDGVIQKELADCMIMLFGIADSLSMSYDDIVKVISDKMEVNKNREWKESGRSGVYSHVVDVTDADDTRNITSVPAADLRFNSSDSPNIGTL